MTKGPVELEVSLSYGLPRKGLPASATFRRWVEAALNNRVRQADIGIRIVGIDEGRHFNHHYRGKDYATNVLSFEAERPEGLPENVVIPLMGDLIICAPVVIREAEEQGKAVMDHFAHLTVHGTLHLLGWDHEDEKEAQAMEQLEREILAAMGVADPY